MPTPSTKTVLIRCDVSHQVGYGHGVRCLALANQLRTDHGIIPTFATRFEALARPFFEDAGYDLLVPDDGMDEAAWLKHLATIRDDKVWIFDIRSDLEADALWDLRRDGRKVAVIDDPSDRRLAANWAFYPPVPQLKTMRWDGFDGECHAGWEWVLLRPAFIDARLNLKSRADQAGDKTPSRILVSMGGSDPFNLTVPVLHELEKISHPIDLTIIIGPGFKDHEQLSAWQKKTSLNHRVEIEPKDMPGLFAAHDLAVIAFGMTAYELAILGVPSVCLTISDDHAQSASVFLDAGLSLVFPSSVSNEPGFLSNQLQRLMNDPMTVQQMSKLALEMVDGGGAARISAMLAKAMEAS